LLARPRREYCWYRARGTAAGWEGGRRAASAAHTQRRKERDCGGGQRDPFALSFSRERDDDDDGHMADHAVLLLKKQLRGERERERVRERVDARRVCRRRRRRRREALPRRRPTTRDSLIILLPPPNTTTHTDLTKNPVEGFSAGLVDDSNLFEWQITVIGPPDTL
jgi:hypothetical protein